MKNTLMIASIMTLVAMLATSVPNVTAQGVSTAPNRKDSPSKSKTTARPKASASARTPFELVPEADAETTRKQLAEIRTIANQLAALPGLKAIASTSCGNYTVEQSLEWCARDHGYNEGAGCGAAYLHAAGAGLFGAVIGPALGNSWDRTNMTNAAAALAKASKAAGWQTGPGDLAVQAAICCQAHNRPVSACLQSHRSAVWDWLIAH
jgi:hypothetical protein